MEFFKFLLYQVFSKPGFFDFKGIELIEILVNISMTLVTFLSVLIAVISVAWAIMRDRETEKTQNTKTLNMINQITSIQRRNITITNDNTILLLMCIDNEEMNEFKHFVFQGNQSISTKSPYIYGILNSIKIIEDENMYAKLSSYRDELVKILFEYHMYLTVEATNIISYKLTIINASLKNLEKLKNVNVFGNADNISNKKFMDNILSLLKNINKLIDDSTKSL